MPFNMFPFSNLHNLNADWLLRTVKQAAEDAAEAAQSAESIAAGVEGQLAKTVKVTPQTWTAAQKSQARANIGAAAVADIPDVSDVLRYTAQDLTSAQKAQARANIGAVADTGLALAHAGAVVYNAEQELTTAQKTRVIGNIGAAPADSYVKYGTQSLTDSEKAQARENIGAVGQADIPTIQGVVRFDQRQSLTVYQKLQARTNIGAGTLPYIFVVSPDELGTGWEVVYGTLTEAAEAISAATDQIFIMFNGYGAVELIPARLNYTGASLTSVSGETQDHYGVNSSIPNIFHSIVITESGGQASVTVTEIQQQQVPPPAPLGNDEGKCLVAGRNTCSWEQITSVVSTVSGTTPTITPADNTIYKCGELASLTISNPPATGAYSIVFTSGSTPTNVTIPDPPALRWQTDDNKPPQGFPAANTRYEINVENTYVVLGEWPVPEVSA